ncbi:MAG: 3-methyl-2-oxobutanoate hydroxymethyltransferase [Pseudomonadota bacterium]
MTAKRSCSKSQLPVNEVLGPKGGEPIVGLTAYTAPVAKRLDRHVDFMLVGDSLAMVLYGMVTTRGIDLDTMIRHGRAVAEHAHQAVVVVDMPFGTYEDDRDTAMANVKRVMEETGCDAVKMEGGADLAPTVAAVTASGIPVMGHIGLMPQRAKDRSGFRTKGKSDTEARRIVKDARAIADAGAFAMVVEGVVDSVAQDVTDAVHVPTIGIGASATCDGQILVTEDMSGLFTDFKPRFVKRYAELGDALEAAVVAYATEVRERTFPGDEHVVQSPNPSKRKEVDRARG